MGEFVVERKGGTEINDRQSIDDDDETKWGEIRACCCHTFTHISTFQKLIFITDFLCLLLASLSSFFPLFSPSKFMHS